MKRTTKKVTKIERTQQKKQTLDYYQKGTGLYLFRNRNASASLELPKASKDGKRWVEPNGTWEGDSYFLSMVPREAILVRTLAEENKEEKVENKLILDQPEQVTKTGKVEHKVLEDLPLNEADPNGAEKEKLLTEDPMSGVTIIRD